MEKKISDEIESLLCMNHLRMELKPINLFLRFFNRCEWSVPRMSDGMKPWRQYLDGISVTHPDHQLISLFSQVFEKSPVTVQR